jgi:hypothetical protein
MNAKTRIDKLEKTHNNKGVTFVVKHPDGSYELIDNPKKDHLTLEEVRDIVGNECTLLIVDPWFIEKSNFL